MQELVCAFLESVSEAFPLEGPVYEFGYSPTVDSASRPAFGGGSPERSYFAFDDCGPAEIDRLEDLVRLPFTSGAARTVVSVHTLEHVFEPRQAVEEMIRILAPGGLLIICSASTVQLADRPDCYWQPTPRAIQRLLAGLEATLIGWQGFADCP